MYESNAERTKAPAKKAWKHSWLMIFPKEKIGVLILAAWFSIAFHRRVPPAHTHRALGARPAFASLHLLTSGVRTVVPYFYASYIHEGRCVDGVMQDEASCTCHGTTARFTHILCMKDVMALAVGGLAEAAPAGNGGQVCAEFVEQLAHVVRSRLHVMVRTRSNTVNAGEAKALVERWREYLPAKVIVSGSQLCL